MIFFRKCIFLLSFSPAQTGGLVLSCKCGKKFLLSASAVMSEGAENLFESKTMQETAPKRLSSKWSFVDRRRCFAMSHARHFSSGEFELGTVINFFLIWKFFFDAKNVE